MQSCLEHKQKGTLEGYGNLSLYGSKGRAHRVAYCKSKGIALQDIRGLVVRHTCDNPRCINPEHLLIGTHQDNADDKVRRGRQQRGVDVNTVKLSPEDITHIRKRIKPYCRLNGARALAKLYGVSHSTINAVVAGKTWGHIEGGI
jgi:hypothetical protein